MLLALAPDDAESAALLGENAVSALALGDAVPALALGDAVSALALGGAVSVSVEVGAGSRVDVAGGVAAALVFGVAVAVFTGFAVFTGALSGSAGAALGDEGMLGAGVVSGVLVSLAGEGDETGAGFALATACGAAMTFASMRWLNANAPAITMAMITPNAIGKCFTEASCRDGQSRSDRGRCPGLRSRGQNRRATTRRFRDSDA